LKVLLLVEVWTVKLEMCRCCRYSDNNRYRRVSGSCCRHRDVIRNRYLYLSVSFTTVFARRSFSRMLVYRVNLKAGALSCGENLPKHQASLELVNSRPHTFGK